MLTRLSLLLLFLLSGIVAHTQRDTTYLRQLYDRCLDFDETKKDSLLIAANLIESESVKLKFKSGKVLAFRLFGIHQEMYNNLEKAIEFYYKCLDEARSLQIINYEISAYSDLAIAYMQLEKPDAAKGYFVLCAQKSLQSGELLSILNSYTNLGGIYNTLHKYDSAKYYLQEAIRLGGPLGESVYDMSTTYNNLGNTYFREGDYKKALENFVLNYKKHSNGSGDNESFWVDHLNLSDTYLQLGQMKLARLHGDSSLYIAELLGSISKKADSYALKSRIEAQDRNYKLAYEYSLKWHELDSAIINKETQLKIAELQERFNVKEKEAQNSFLMARVERQMFQNRAISVLSILLGLVVVLVAIAFITKRNANRRLEMNNILMQEQNEKLIELNREKNSLISIVSHDLNTPFATIQLWVQLMQTDAGNLTEEQQKSLLRIQQAGEAGQALITRILDVEKHEKISVASIELTKFDMIMCMESLKANFEPMAAKKDITITLIHPRDAVYIMSDRQLVNRIFENLVSNAIKYSPKGRQVTILLKNFEELVQVEVLDVGVGIASDELPFIFDKYSKVSSVPTDGESSTGLGLSIVKRIVEELNGSIACSSELGKGTRFNVILKK